MKLKIKFKYARLKAEWKELLVKNPSLVSIVLYYAELVGGELVITHIKRTVAQQKKFYPNRKYKLSVHQLFRGVDCRIKNKNKSEEAEIDINRNYPYGKGKIKTVLIHNIGLGTHAHIQNRG